MANLLDFGTVTVTAAGTGEPLKFVNVPDPEEIEEEISSRIEGAKILREDLEDNLTMEAIYTFFEKNDEYLRKRYREGRPLYGDNM
jgi:hypothetical protein